jgi:uncharacterized membrane protein YfcA
VPAAAAFVAALLAGAANAAAGGGTLISFPVLLWLGVGPVEANVTSAMALWPGSAGAAWGYRRYLREPGPRWRVLLLPAVLGGFAGGLLLVRLPSSIFASIAPFLVLAAAGLIAIEPVAARRVAARAERDGRPRSTLPAALAMFGIAVYGGYFGAGIGLLLLASLGLGGMHDIHRANAWKNVLAFLIKGVAIAYFATAGVAVWHLVLLMAAGAVLGGWAGGVLLQRLSHRALRRVVVGMGIAIGAAMLLG